MDLCQSLQALDSEHRWEWHGEKGGVITYVCVNVGCGQTQEQFIDCGSGC